MTYAIFVLNTVFAAMNLGLVAVGQGEALNLLAGLSGAGVALVIAVKDL